MHTADEVFEITAPTGPHTAGDASSAAWGDDSPPHAFHTPGRRAAAANDDEVLAVVRPSSQSAVTGEVTPSLMPALLGVVYSTIAAQQAVKMESVKPLDVAALPRTTVNRETLLNDIHDLLD